jgi:hypothetical protein
MKKASKVSAKGSARAKAPAAASRNAAARRTNAAAKTTATRSANRAVPEAQAPCDDAAGMAAWQAAMTPGDGHRRLAPMVGTFVTKSRLWMSPDGPPSEGIGVSENRLVLGGRYLEQNYRATMMGMPFEGIGYTGYDNARKKYVGTWMDTAGTGIMNSVGIGKPSDRDIAFAATSFDPRSGAEIAFRCVVRVQDQDHHTFEMWARGPAGKERRTLFVEYARK